MVGGGRQLKLFYFGNLNNLKLFEGHLLARKLREPENKWKKNLIEYIFMCTSSA